MCVYNAVFQRLNIALVFLGHTAQVQSLSAACDKVTSCSVDDTVKEIDVTSQSYKSVTKAT